MEGEGVTPPYMALAQVKFCLKLPEHTEDRELKEKLLSGIKQGNMAPYYKQVCTDLGWSMDQSLFEEMSAANKAHMAVLEKEHESSVLEEEDQVSALWKAKLDYLCSIGDREAASALANSKLTDKTTPKTHRIDAAFTLFRLAYFHDCNIKGMTEAIEKGRELVEGSSGGGDWSARNKLKAYEGVFSLAVRDWAAAARLFVDVVPTFESYELADFATVIRYTVLSCMIALPRADLKQKLLHHGVTAQALHSYKPLKDYFLSLYEGRYSDFLVRLAEVETEMKEDPLLHPHYRHYVQEMRLRAYKQILQAYRSLSLDYMSQSFGVSNQFIEREVAKFAATGRLQCKIDSVSGTVVTSATSSEPPPDIELDRSLLYKATVRKGDILLNRLKKLARVMDF